MFDRLGTFAPHILGIMRILFGVMMASHGSQKMFGFFGAMPAEVPWYIDWIAGPLEFFGGILIAIGLFTRPVAFLMSGLMAAAYFHGHQGYKVFWPKVNGGELAVIYCWFSLYLAAQGPGAFALDNLWRRRKQQG